LYELLPAAEVPGLVGVPAEPQRRRREREDTFTQRLAVWTDRAAAARTPDLIWLPNDLVTGAGGETPPVARVRQVQDVMTLRLLIDLYHAQELPEDGGVSRRVTYKRFERVRVGQRGEFNVWGFRETGSWVDWQLPVAACHRREQLTQSEKKAGANPGTDYFRRQGHLIDLGLLEWVPTLFESEAADAECLHPSGQCGTQSLEDRLGAAAHRAGLALLTEGQRDWVAGEGLWLVPVFRHIANVAMIGVARLHYRPRTTKTAAWLAELVDKGERLVERYCAIADGETAHAVNM
jgi:hypothetical protein